MDGPTNPFARPPHHHPTSSHDSSTDTSHPSPQSLIRPPPGMFALSLPPPPPPPHQHGMPRSPGNIGTPQYPHQYGASSMSPSTASGSLQDHIAPGEAAYSGSGISQTHLSASLSAQKRAYRQRRKDPSCDACRERKVKCDATETSSCSECHQRSVKCQFTKETNRRMSSIKQVQDLHTQLEVARAQITELERRLTNGGGPESSGPLLEGKVLDLPDVTDTKPRRTPQTSPPQNLAHVQRNARIWGHGIYRPPAPNRQGVSGLSFYPQTPQTPPKSTIDYLVGRYYRSIHAIAPAVNFQELCQELDNARQTQFHRSPHIWLALLFAVLGCGTLHKVDNNNTKSARPDPDGQRYIDEASKAFSLWTDDFTIDHARIALLISIYLHEIGLKSASSTWLGTSVRVAVDLGLHRQDDHTSSASSDGTGRVWWSIYTWDRLQCLEIGRPLLISDDECDIIFPTSFDDRFAVNPYAAGHVPTSPDISFWNHMMLTWVVRFVGQLRKTLVKRQTSLDARILNSYDEYFEKILLQMPHPFKAHADTYLDPSSLFPALTLQSARLSLYRLKIPSIQYGERIDALRKCQSVAMDTVSYIRRSQNPQPYGSPSAAHTQLKQWSELLAASAPSMLCTHLWRCTLFLCLNLDFENALVCLGASAAIGDVHPINIACGRNIWFFLKMLPDRISNSQKMDQDEEMVAYAAGDMQGNPDTAWIWSGQESGTKFSVPATDSPVDTQNYNQAARSTALLSDAEVREWKGWAQVDSKMRSLWDQKKAFDAAHPSSRHHSRPQESSPVEPHHPATPSYYPPPENPHKRLQLQPPSSGVKVPQAASLTQPSPISSTASPNTASRISIASII